MYLVHHIDIPDDLTAVVTAPEAATNHLDVQILRLIPVITCVVQIESHTNYLAGLVPSIYIYKALCLFVRSSVRL